MTGLAGGDAMIPAVEAGGVSIPKLGIGTYMLTGETCVEAVAGGLRAGYRHVDTAEMYGNETEVGAGIRASGLPREDVFVTSKVWHEHLASGVLEAAAEASLTRLGLDQLDLYLIHWPSRQVPLAEAMAGLCQVHKRGLARAIGVSNFPAGMLREAIALADVPLAVNQVEYHPYLDQSELLRVVRAAGLGLTAYCPLARGEILGDPVVERIAESHGVTPAAVALAWLIGQDGVIAIPKSRNVARLAENLRALDVTLDPSERAEITALAQPSGRMVRPAFAPDFEAG